MGYLRHWNTQQASCEPQRVSKAKGYKCQGHSWFDFGLNFTMIVSDRPARACHLSFSHKFLCRQQKNKTDYKQQLRTAHTSLGHRTNGTESIKIEVIWNQLFACWNSKQRLAQCPNYFITFFYWPDATVKCYPSSVPCQGTGHVTAL